MKARIVKKLNWLKSFIFLVALVIIGLIYAYVHFSLFTEGSFKSIKVPVHIEEVMDSVMGKIDIIVGIQVIKVDLQKNLRYIKYTSIKSKIVKKMYDEFLSDNISLSIPVFTDNEIQNSIMLSSIKHEFLCYPFINTTSYSLVPALAKYVSTICVITVPTNLDKFSGFVAVFLSRPPTDIERDLIRIESTSLSQQAAEAIK